MIGSIFLNRRELPIWTLLILLWSTIQLYLFSQSGVKIGWDSAFYIDGASDLLNFKFPDGRGKWYFSYILFLSGFLSLGISEEFIICFQIFLSFIVLFVLFSTTLALSKDRITSYVAVFLYIIWMPIHEWNVFLYTESLFTSCLIICFYFLLRVKTIGGLFLFLPIFIFTIFIRPTGFAFFVAVSFFIVITLIDKLRLRPFKTTLILGMISCSLVLISIMLQNYELVDSYAKAEIIYPNISLGIIPPKDLFIPKEHDIVIFEFFSFVYFNPTYFAKISVLKLLLFFGNIKPYFSVLHNLLIILFLYPVYYFALIGGKKLQAPLKMFFLLFIGIQGLTVMFTTENWDGRFLIPVLPFVFILASLGVGQYLSQIYFRRRSIVSRKNNGNITRSKRFFV